MKSFMPCYNLKLRSISSINDKSFETTIFVTKLQGLELPPAKMYPQLSSVLLENPSDCSVELRVIATLITGNILQCEIMDRCTIGEGSITELNQHP